MEELQSDWGQGARQQGISQPVNYLYYRNPVSGFTSPTFKDEAVAKEYFNGLPEKLRNTVQPVRWSAPGPGVPDGPYIGNTQQWTDLGLKRALIEAANGGYSHLSWTPGEDQADRYLLTKHIRDLSYSPHTQVLQARSATDRKALNELNVPPEKLPDYVGREVAEKLLAQPRARISARRSFIPIQIMRRNGRRTAGTPSRAKTSRSAARG